MKYQGMPQPLPQPTGQKSKGTSPHGRGKVPQPNVTYQGREEYRPSGKPKSHQGPTQIGPMKNHSEGRKE